MRQRLLLTAASIALMSLYARADVKLPAIISDNMCLQAGKTLPIWGTAVAGEEVTVSLNGQTQKATAGADGKWMVKLPAMQVGGPLEMTVAGKNTLTVKNIVVGEVWVASGQSNMEFGFRGTHNVAEEAPKTRRRPRARKDAVAEVAATAPAVEASGPEAVAETDAPVAEEEPKPKRRSRAKTAPVVDLAEPAAAPAPKPARITKPAAEPVNDAAAESPATDEPLRSGWWSRTFG